MGVSSSSSVGTITPDDEDQRLGQRQWCRLILRWQSKPFAEVPPPLPNGPSPQSTESYSITQFVSFLNPFAEAPPPLPNGPSPPSTVPSPITQFANFFGKYPGLAKFMGGKIVRYWSCGMVENHKCDVPVIWFVKSRTRIRTHQVQHDQTYILVE